MGKRFRWAWGAALLAGLAGAAWAAGARLDQTPVSAAQFAAFLLSQGGKDAPAGTGGEGPAVSLTWHQARAYCAAQGKRLPSAQEWIGACQAKEIQHTGWIWEWTTTDAGPGEHGAEQPFKLLCGPGPECSCTHAYHPDWKNEVKGFRCARPDPNVRLLEGGRAAR